MFSKAVGPSFPYLSRQRYSSKYPESNSAELPLTALSFLLTCFHRPSTLLVHAWVIGSTFSKKANTWIGGRNNIRNFLRKHATPLPINLIGLLINGGCYKRPIGAIEFWEWILGGSGSTDRIRQFAYRITWKDFVNNTMDVSVGYLPQREAAWKLYVCWWLRFLKSLLVELKGVNWLGRMGETRLREGHGGSWTLGLDVHRFADGWVRTDEAVGKLHHTGHTEANLCNYLDVGYVIRQESMYLYMYLMIRKIVQKTHWGENRKKEQKLWVSVWVK